MQKRCSSRFKVEWLHELVETELTAATKKRKNLERYSVIVTALTTLFVSCANKHLLSANLVLENVG